MLMNEKSFVVPANGAGEAGPVGRDDGEHKPATKSANKAARIKHDENERDRKEASVRSSKKARRRPSKQELRKFLPTLSFDHRRG